MKCPEKYTFIEDVDDPMPDGELPCKGHGTCIDGKSENTLGWFECLCDNGYTGDRLVFFQKISQGFFKLQCYKMSK